MLNISASVINLYITDIDVKKTFLNFRLGD